MGYPKGAGLQQLLGPRKIVQGDHRKRQEVATRLLINTTEPLSTNNLTTSSDGLLSNPGQRGLAVACRSAHTMALSVCQTTKDTRLWLQMPHTVATIGSNIQAYEIMQEARRKHVDRGSSAQGASIALRDVLTLLIVNAYATFEDALNDIARTTKLPLHAITLLRSQAHLSRTSISRLAQRTSAIEGEVLKIYPVPLAEDEIADIHAAFCDCAQRTALIPKRKPFRPPKNSNKKT